MDDAYISGERSGKRGRGSENKIPFIAAVETRDGMREGIVLNVLCATALAAVIFIGFTLSR